MMHAAHVSRWTVAGLLALGVVSMSIPSPVGPYSAHAQPRPFPRPKPPAPKPTPPSSKMAFATLLVSVDLDCQLYVDDADAPIAIPAYKPTRVPIAAGEHFVRWYVASADVNVLGRVTLQDPGQQLYEYKLSEEVRIVEALTRGWVVRDDLMWTVRDNGIKVGLDEADAYCEACRVGGYEDWRVPTIDELNGLYVAGNSYSTSYQLSDGVPLRSDVHIAKPFRLTTPFVWSSTSDGSATLGFFFDQGKQYKNVRGLNESGRVLCVRRVKE